MIERTTTLPRRLIDYTGEARSVPTQRRLRDDAVNGKIPAHQAPNGIWLYDTADTPVIAAVYGLSPKAPTSAKASRKVATPALAAA